MITWMCDRLIKPVWSLRCRTGVIFLEWCSSLRCNALELDQKMGVGEEVERCVVIRAAKPLVVPSHGMVLLRHSTLESSTGYSYL